MKARDKAMELVEKFLPHVHQAGEIYKTTEEREFENAKDCALITIDEILKLPFENQSERNYWQEVKIGIEKL